MAERIEKGETKYDCSRGCNVERTPNGELKINYDQSCCKLGSFNWLEGIPDGSFRDLYEVRFKNTRKVVFRNTSGQLIKQGDLVVVEATNGHDLGIVTLEGPIVLHQLARHRIDPRTYEFRRIYRRAKILDIERWQEAIAREHKTMIRARQIAARLGLDMKIGDVEFQGDGTKAIFYYIADERVDFRQLIKDFAEEFHIRIEMKQIGARQEAGLIGGLGVCGRALCCSKFMADFQSITTQAARCQDLSLNPQKLAGQCSKLKCCINYEASCYIDAQRQLPTVREPLEFEDGKAFLVKTDILRGKMYFSYEPGSMTNLYELTGHQVREIIEMNRGGVKPASLQDTNLDEKANEFITAVGDDSITRFDEQRRKKGRHKHGQGRGGERGEKCDKGEKGEKTDRGDRNDKGQRGEKRGNAPRDDKGQKPQGGQNGQGGDGNQNQQKGDRANQNNQPKGDKGPERRGEGRHHGRDNRGGRGGDRRDNRKDNRGGDRKPRGGENGSKDGARES